MAIAEQGKYYQHFKGGRYQVMAIAKESESLEEMVIYQSMDDPEKIWARPRGMFEDQVEKDSKLIDRFTLINL